MNTFRFGFVTKKGAHQLLPRMAEMEFHFAVTLEGRDDAELPEQVLVENLRDDLVFYFCSLPR